MVASDVAITKGNRNIVVELAALGIPSVSLADGLNRIDDFRTATANVSDHVMLVNAEGYWMSSPSKQDEWGFMRSEARTF